LYFKTPKGVWKTPFTRNVKTDLDAPDNSNDQIWPVNRTPNDWDTVKTPDRPLPKNMGKYHKRKWFAGDICVVWYLNEFYMGKVVLVIPSGHKAKVHLYFWDYDKDKEERVSVDRNLDVVYRLNSFDVEGREETTHLEWLPGDICYAYYQEENQYYQAWFQGYQEDNPNYVRVIFEGFEDDGLYTVYCEKVLPPYMYDENYSICTEPTIPTKFALKQELTCVRKQSLVLRSSRMKRVQRHHHGDNNVFQEPNAEERPWINGVVGLQNAPTGTKLTTEVTMDETTTEVPHVLFSKEYFRSCGGSVEDELNMSKDDDDDDDKSNTPYPEDSKYADVNISQVDNDSDDDDDDDDDSDNDDNDTFKYLNDENNFESSDSDSENETEDFVQSFQQFEINDN